MNETVAIHLHGPLADKYGAEHHFAVRSPREAIKALDANYPGFRHDFIQSEIYYIQADGDWRDGDDAAFMPVSRQLHLVPRIEGRAFFGAALIGLIFPSIAGTLTATLIGGLLVTGLLIGVSLLLSPKVKKKEEEKKTESFAFTGPENVTAQGVAVPVVYGRVHCGSVVVSAGLEVQTLLGGAPNGGNYTGPENLSSLQLIKMIDLVSEGPIKGLVNGFQSVFFDGVPLQNSDGSWNTNYFTLDYVQGYPGQRMMPGFGQQQQEIAVGLKLKWREEITRTIINPDVDRVRITVSTPGLNWIDYEGDVHGATVRWRMAITNAEGYSNLVIDDVISGKTTSRYQKTIVVNLPYFGEGVWHGPWNIVVYREDPQESDDERLHDEIWWDSYTEIIDDGIIYQHSAVFAVQINADQFQTIPSRTYLIDGLQIRIPTNYDPYAGTYSGVWNGTWKVDWTDNPAFIWYDMVVNSRYGLGRFISESLVDKWALYAIAQWCDQLVPNGRGGYERRYTCNIQITSQEEAFDLLQQLASIFRGFAYWAGGILIPVADRPIDANDQFTNANVIDGIFNYSGNDIRARHSLVASAWNDPELLGQMRIAVVEDQPAISRYGIQQLDMAATGCTRESQALRAGKWALFTELYEGEIITFSTGLQGAYVQPGEIIRVMDVNIAGTRRGGRIGEASTTTHIVFDSAVGGFSGTAEHYLYCEIGEGQIEMQRLSRVGPDNSADTYAPFSAAPAPDTIFIINALNELEPTYWRITNVKQSEAAIFEISGIRLYPDKWTYIEQNLPVIERDISDIKLRPDAVFNLQYIEFMVATSPISVGVFVTLSWTSTAPLFDVYWRPRNGNWTHFRTPHMSVDLPVTEGPWEFIVQAISALGIRGVQTPLAVDIIGRFAPPEPPKQFRIKISDGVALFEWLPAPELDVIIGGHFELRHSSHTIGANWASAQIVIPSIPGAATSVETVYRTGTWFLRTFDIVGQPSATAAIVIALQPDGRYNEFARICENPDFLGSRFYTEVKQPQQWLVLGATGGLWDAQMANMNGWPDVDLLIEDMPDPPQSEARHGWYHFQDRIDAGGVFTVRFSADVLVFPYAEGSDFIDDRLNNCDEWNDWDDVSADLGGQVQLYIRTTNNDPASPGAAWGEWQVFSPIEYTARGFEFRADLYAPAGQNIGVEELCIIADLRMKMDSAEDVAYPAAITHVTFKVKFYLVPAVVITVQNALATDTIQVLNKTREGFDLSITNPPPTHVTRTFDWQARGF